VNQNETRTLWISIASALFAVFLLYSYTQEKSIELTKKFGAKKRVVVATQDINDMQTIDETMLQVVEKPADFVEPGAFDDPENVVGLVALAPIKSNEQLLQSKVTKPSPLTGLSLQVSPSKRAIALPANELSAVGKLLKPGDRVDVVAAVDVGKGPAARREVKTLMQDVVVLATGPRIVNDLPVLYERPPFNANGVPMGMSLREDMNFSTITVEASPEESQDLIFLLSTSPGSIFLTLRHPSDHTKRKYPESTLDSLMGKVSESMMQMRAPAAAPPPPPAPPPAKPKKKGPFIDL
jgi:pilus assembly protein CpaB